MSAPSISGEAFAGKPAVLNLSLDGKMQFPRKLSIGVARQHVTVGLYVESEKLPKRIVYAIAKLADCYLTFDKYSGPALWIGSTAFDVTDDEAQQIRSAFEPLGLRIAIEAPIAAIKDGVS